MGDLLSFLQESTNKYFTEEKISKSVSPFVKAIVIRSDEGLTLQTSTLKLFTVANLRYQLNW